ncbi:MAG: hypothetical protein ACJA2C_000645 [Marinoscillum sp.]|jgi:uncharacterized protein (DUF2141 family)
MILLILSFLMFWQQPNVTSVKVTGIKVASGQLRVAFYDSKKNFLHDSKLTCSAVIEITKAGEMIIPVTCPAGLYGMAVYHDVNSNGKLDMTFLGTPKEPYGFSRNAMGTFGPPSFSEAKVDTSLDTSIVIDL